MAFIIYSILFTQDYGFTYFLTFKLLILLLRSKRNISILMGLDDMTGENKKGKMGWREAKCVGTSHSRMLREK